MHVLTNNNKTGEEQKDDEYWRLSLTDQQPTLGVVRLQIPIGQFKKLLDSLQRHFGLQDAV